MFIRHLCGGSVYVWHKQLYFNEMSLVLHAFAQRLRGTMKPISLNDFFIEPDWSQIISITYSMS